MLKILIPTCDKYLHLIEGLIYTINKYWENHGKVIIVGYKEPTYDLYENMSFYSMGSDRGPKYWSDDLITFFDGFEDEYFINFIDDTTIIRDVNVERIDILTKYVIENNIDKLFLTGSLVEPMRSKEYVKLDLLEVYQHSDYRTSLQSAIVKKSYFTRYLKPNMTPWEFELQNSKNDGAKILTVKINENTPIIYSHLYRDNIGLLPDWYVSKKHNAIMFDEDKAKIIKILKK